MIWLKHIFRRGLHAKGAPAFITMFDCITVGNLPRGAAAYAGYVDGYWPTFHLLGALFPHARLLSIAVFASDDAECLDVENGDATIAQAPGWVLRQIARGVYRPVIYTSASNMKPLEAFMASHGIARSKYRIWSAHYGAGSHVCGPKTCGYGLSNADGTQFTSSALGISLDQSLLTGSFFDGPPKPPPPPAEDDDMPYGQLSSGQTQGVPVPAGRTKLSLFADFTTAQSPLGVRVAVHSASKGYTQIIPGVALNDSKPHVVIFTERDVDAVSLVRTDPGTEDIGYLIS